MSQLILATLATINSSSFMKMKHPMNMGLMLLIQTVLVCLMSSNMMQTAWFAYILFLVFLGGMMVLFIYMTSVASNEMFKEPKYKMTAIMMSSPFIIMMIFLMKSEMMVNNTLEAKITTNILSTESTSLEHLFNYPNSTMTIFMVLYLLLTLVVVVSNTEVQQGPLRSNH